MRLILLLLLGMATTFSVADKPALPASAPRSPAEALKTFHAQDGFRLELIAHEPLAYDPYYFDTLLGTMFEHGGGYCVVFGDSSAKYVSRTKELENLMRLPATSSDDANHQRPILDYFKRN